MGKCKLYIRSGGLDWFIGNFPNQEKAEAFYNAAIAMIETKYGTNPQPIYVETKKGK